MGQQVTPYQVALCILTDAYVKPDPEQNLPLGQDLCLFLVREAISSASFKEPPLPVLLRRLHAAVPAEDAAQLQDFLVSRLSLANCPDDLFQFFVKIRELLSTSGAPGEVLDEEAILLQPGSALGIFVRRVLLAFNSLSFEATCRLLTNIGAYCRYSGSPDADLLAPDEVQLEAPPTEESDDEYPQYEEEYEEAQRSGRPPLRDAGFRRAFGKRVRSVRGPGTAVRPSKQVEAFLQEQADVIEREVGCASVAAVEAQLGELERLAPGVAKVQYVRYLAHMHAGDVPAATDALHRYFDYGTGQDGSALTAEGGAKRQTGRFQNALLNLGSMHVHFGHAAEATQALNAAVRVAQQSSDDVCLAHALAALCHLLAEAPSPGAAGASGPAGAPRQQLLLLLRTCLRRAHELRLPHLVAFSRLALARFDMQHVRLLPPAAAPLPSAGPLGTDPVQVCCLLRSSSLLLLDAIGSSPALPSAAPPALRGSLNLAASTSGVGDSLGRAPSQLAASFSAGADGLGSGPGKKPSMAAAAVARMAGTAHLLKAAAWDLYASAPLAHAATLVHATCYDDVPSADDLCLAACQLASQAAAARGPAEGLRVLAAGMARPKLAVAASQAVNRRVRITTLRLQHDQALLRADLHTAEVAVAELAALACEPGAEAELRADAGLRHASTLLAGQCYEEAAAAGAAVHSLAVAAGLQLDAVRALLLLAKVHLAAGAPAAGLPYALSAVTLARAFHLDLLAARAALSLAELALLRGPAHAPQAVRQIQRVLPVVLAHGSLELRADAHFALGRAWLTMLKPEQGKQSPALILEPLQAAFEAYRDLQAHPLCRKVLLLTALYLNTLGWTKQRDQVARLCRSFPESNSNDHPV